MSYKCTDGNDHLDAAIINVARCAQEVIDTAERQGNRYVVDEDVVADLKDAIKTWQEATQAMLLQIFAEANAESNEH